MDAKTLEPLVPWLGSGAVTLLIAASALYRYLVVQGRDDTKELQAARQSLSADQKMLFDHLRAEIERKTARALELERVRHKIEEDRDEGWDKGRTAEEMGRSYRHELVNLYMAVHAAGKFGAPMPDALLRIYEAGQKREPIPPELVPPPMPVLQHMPRKPAP